ncbi:hypothetical protein BGZ46_010355 [Entomortierella lignicola]|nr:hypothetical protein BGZ46_010355 [Entomortierella lignicola]
MRNEHNTQEEMAVPGNLVGLIIGRGGENLKRIERETGCRVQFSQDGNPGDRERFVNIIGQPAGIADAKRQIQEIITSSQTGERHGSTSYGGGGYGSGNYGMGGGGGGGGGGNGGGYGRGGTTATIQIPSTKVGLVIGRGGETIRDLQDRSGARIAVTPPHDHNSPSRTVSITGDDGAIERAKAFIEEIVSDMAPRGSYGGNSGGGGGGGGGGYQNTPPVTMTVPQESIGLVIGRGGETVKQLQIQSRAKIQVQQVDPGMPPPSDRTINLFGPPEAVEYAKQLIMEKVAGARDNDRYGAQRDQSGYGNGGGYGGYQQQQQYQQQQPAQSSASSGYGQYGGYATPAATGAATAATAGYTPEQQAAYAQYYGYQYGAGYQYGTAASAATGTSAATTSSTTDAAATTPATTGTDASAYGTYDYSRYLAGQYGTTASATATSAASAAPTASTVSTSSSAPTTTDTSAGAAGTSAPDYSAYYAQQGYNPDAYQQYYSQYYGYQAAAGATAGAGTTDSTSATTNTTTVATENSGSADGASSNTAAIEQTGNETASSS